MLRTRVNEKMTWQQDHLRALPTKTKKKSNGFKNICIGIFSAWLIGIILFFVFYFNKNDSKSTPSLRKETSSTTRKLDINVDDIDTIIIQRETVENTIKNQVEFANELINRNNDENIDGKLDLRNMNRIANAENKIPNADNQYIGIDKSSADVLKPLLGNNTVPLETKSGRQSENNINREDNFNDIVQVNPPLLIQVGSDIQNVSLNTTNDSTSPKAVERNLNKEIDFDSIFKDFVKERGNVIAMKTSHGPNKDLKSIHHIELHNKSTHQTTSSRGEGNWEEKLLRSAHEKMRIQFPECSAKIRWYCHERHTDCDSIANIDAMQALVLDEPASQGRHCPPVATFSMGRVWRSAWFIDENVRRNSYVPQWRHLLLRAGREVASSLQFTQAPPSKVLPTAEQGIKSLLIMVLSFPRPNNPALLLKTVKALQTQIESLQAANQSMSITVVVMNSGGNQPHVSFTNASTANELNGGSKVTNFAYFDNPFLNEQPLPEHWVTSKVGQQISNQSWHVMSGLAVASQLEKHFTMVVEDDMELCEGALPVLLDDIQSADEDNDFSALLVSYGLNGFIIQTKDITPAYEPSFSLSEEKSEQGSGYLLDFLIANRNPIGCEECITPPDIAVYEWSRLHHYPDYHMDLSFRISEDRKAYTRSSNLFSHLGTLSSTFDNRIFEAEQYRCGGILQFSQSDPEVQVLRQHVFKPHLPVDRSERHKHPHDHGDNMDLIDIVEDNSGGHINVLRLYNDHTEANHTTTDIKVSDQDEGAGSSSKLRGGGKNKPSNDAILKLKEKKKMSAASHHSTVI